MVRRVVLLAALVAGVLAPHSWTSTSFAAASGCSPLEVNAGMCVNGDLGDTSVDLYGEVSVPGVTPDEGPGWEVPGPVEPEGECVYSRDGVCQIRVTVPGVPAVTWADLVSFRPDPGVDVGEPEGWAVVGLDANFYSTAEAQVVVGTLLGRPASVRFTPVVWTWDYGDGAVVARATGGRSWAALGVGEFDPTATSHVFDEAGTFTVELVVGFSAQYRIQGSSWITLDGVLPVPTNPLPVVAGDAKTVLVDQDCHTNPTGPGC